MSISTPKRIALGVAAVSLAIGGVTACDSGESATENFEKDLGAVGLTVDGNVTIDREKKTLGMAPVNFIAGSTPKPKKDGAGSDSKSKKDKKAPSASPSTKSTKAPKVTETLEALVKLNGSTNCRVELERPKKPGADSKKVKDRDVEYYSIGELVTNGGNEVDIDSQPGIYDMKAIVKHVKDNPEWHKLCFA